MKNYDKNTFTQTMLNLQTEIAQAKNQYYFDTVKRQFELEYSLNCKISNCIDMTETLDVLAKMITFSTLKKIINKTYDQTLIKYRNGLINDIKTVDNTEIANYTEYFNDLNSKGSWIDSKSHNNLDVLGAQNLSDGFDLLQECKAIILDVSAKYSQDIGCKVGFLDTDILIKKPSKSVYLHSEHMGERYRTTKLIQLIYNQLQQYIRNNNSIKIDNFKDVYEQKMGGACDVYFKQKRYYDLQCSEQIKVDKMIESLNLTSRQAAVLHYRLQGLNISNIALKMQVSRTAVQKHLKLIQAKYNAIK